MVVVMAILLSMVRTIEMPNLGRMGGFAYMKRTILVELERAFAGGQARNPPYLRALGG
jgi:hypothetical protein